MRILLPILLLLCFKINAQIPPAIQWQKCFGGTDRDGMSDLKPTQDGGFIMAGSSRSNNGDLTSNNGFGDVWVLKVDATGNKLWQKSFGGLINDFANGILQTIDGGYILVGTAYSGDGDVVGNHGSADVWVIKLSAVGSMQWQKCYGGSRADIGSSIRQTSDGGYIIGAYANSADGDVTGHHGSTDTSDVWILKIDALGSLQWQKSFGGREADDITTIIQTPDGGYFFTATTQSSDGDIGCGRILQDLWIVKLDNAGNIQWKRCLGGNWGELSSDVHSTPDGGFIIAGLTYSDDLPGYHPNGPNLIDYGDAWIIKTDAFGNVQWQRLLGGGSHDEANSIQLTADGGYIVAGVTSSTDGDICSNNGATDFWIIKLNSNGTTQWQKTYGGSSSDGATSILLTPDGGYMVGGYTLSNDGDVSGNHGEYDSWLLKLSFPGVPVLPLVTITASDSIICPNQDVTFIATSILGGDNPSYQWKINGVNTGTNNDTVTINTFNGRDVISCVLTSNSPCVTSPTDTSNSITIAVDPSLAPVNFLPDNTTICDYGFSFSAVNLKTVGSFKTYLWSNGATDPVITVSQPGSYWVSVTTNNDCPARDTVLVTSVECIKGLFIPSAFTPNNDGKNDVLKPIFGGNIKQFKLTITNRWGRIVFQTSDETKGWDGTYKGIRQDSNVFVWICTYQFEGEEIKFAKGTVAVIR